MVAKIGGGYSYRIPHPNILLSNSPETNSETNSDLNPNPNPDINPNPT